MRPEMPRDLRLAAILVVAAILAGGLAFLLVDRLDGTRGLARFQGYWDLAAFLDRRSSLPYLREGWGFGGSLTGPGSGPTDGAASYTGTNVQVEGVDEIDWVKTDGTYLYLVSRDWTNGTAHEVVIARAYPATQLSVVARIDVSGLMTENATTTYVSGLFVQGDRLAVVVTGYGGYAVGGFWEGMPYGRTMTYVGVYDLSDVGSPTLLRSHGVSGYLVTARMIAPFVYVIANDYVQKVDEVYVTPRVCDDDACGDLAPTDVYYDPSSANPGSYTNVLALDLTSDASSVLSVVTGYTSTVYMSHAALYLAFLKWNEPSPLFLAPQVVTTWTTVHKVSVAGVTMEAIASGDVSGWLLNQFSLDEYAGYLRVATTSTAQSAERFEQTNNVYVLDGALRLVGSLEGLAPRESIYAARFLGERLYLVTFEKIDPLFVIDLSVPADPRVLGYLEMPGFSEYLHPFDEGRLIGVGKDAAPDEFGNFSWFQGLKLSLFDVTDVGSPEELARLAIGDRGTTSEALQDHKAFLFLRDRGILVIPVSLALIDPNAWEDPLPPWAYGETVWIGAYVLRVGLTSGFEVVGRITHFEGDLDPYVGWDSLRVVSRSAVIGDVLYTVSGGFVKANALADLAEIGGLAY